MTRPVALVTGAARRIGAAITSTLHGAGYDVIVHYRHSRQDAARLAASLEAQRPDSTHLLQFDLDADLDAEAIATACFSRWGRVDCLVNNASTFVPGAIGTVTPAAWNHLLHTNLTAPFFLSQALAPALGEARGVIINIVDIHAERPLRGYPVYSIAKAGLQMLTRSLAVELAPTIRVNGVSPGIILWPEGDGEMTAAERTTMLDSTPLARTGAVSDIADAVRYLACDAPYVTGQVLAVDGGLSL